MVEQDRFAKFLRGDWADEKDDKLSKYDEVKALVQTMKHSGQTLDEGLAQKIVHHGYHRWPENEQKKYPATVDTLMPNPVPLADRVKPKLKKGEKPRKLTLAEAKRYRIVDHTRDDDRRRDNMYQAI